MHLKILGHPVFTSLNFHMPMIVDMSHPVVMLTGENGSGKSTLLHSMFYALKGQQVDGYVYRLDKGDVTVDQVFLFDAEQHNPRTQLEVFKDNPEMLEFLQMASHGQVMLSMFRENFPLLPDGTILLLDEPEMALSISNQRRILKMLLELADQRKFRIIAATHSPILIDSPDTYVINLDRHVNRNVAPEDLGTEGASTIQWSFSPLGVIPAMATTAADILINSLLDWGVEVIFGIPGDGINGIMEALRKRQDKIRFIQVRHEEAAAFMACAWAKFTGKLGVCLATSGPGGIHLLNGLYDAKGDGQPVLAITGLHYHDLLSTHAQQDVELDKVFQDVCVYNARIMGAAHVENVADLACRTAVTRHGVAHLTFPVDLQEEEAPDSGSEHNVLHHTSDVFAWSAGLPEEHQLRRAADILNSASKPAILVGRGALGAGDKVLAVAETLGAPIAKAVLGKAAVADDHALTTGSIGLLGTTASEELMRNCDTLLMIGTSFPYIEHLPKPGQARGVQIDRDPARIGLRFPVDVGLVGDTSRVLEGLAPMLQRRQDRSFLERIQHSIREWRDAQRLAETSEEQPMKPQRLAAEVGARLREDAIVAVDSGTVTAWWARHIPAKPTQMHSVSGMMASMGCALPYAIAAQLAYPERQVIAFVGDGGMAMLMCEFATCVKYKLPVKVVVVKNNTLGQIKWEQLMFLGNPEYGCDLHPIDFAAFARACGADGYSVKHPSRLGAVLDEAFASAGPVIVDVEVDPLEAPMFANMKPEQAKKLREALAKGEPDADGILENVRKQRARELV